MSKQKFIEENLTTPVRYSCDVCVAGGGVAGIAAALSAARAGRARGSKTEVILLERGFMLGGLATAGLVTIYLPICDGMGRQVCYGIADELLRLSIESAVEDMYPEAWLEGGDIEERKKKRFQVQYNAQLFAVSAERVLREAGVRIIYGATAVSAHTSDGKITHINIEGKGGRESIEVRRSVVDATGDGDICKLSLAKTAIYEDGNKLAAWYYGYGNGSLKLYMCGVHDTPGALSDTDLPDLKRYSGLDTSELSELVEAQHATFMHNYLERKNSIPDLLPVTISTIPTVRMTRRLVGEYEQDISEAEEKATYPDSVGIYPNWRRRGPVYELPLRVLYGREVKNLLVAGRCISVTDAMWDITRVIPVCAVSGEAAGAAAALCSDMHCADVEMIREYLREAGVLVSRNMLENE